MSNESELSGSILYSVRYQQMLYDEREMSRQPTKKEFAEIKQIEEDKRRFLEENSRAVREIETRKCMELDRVLELDWNRNRNEHTRLLNDAKKFIERDEAKRIEVLVKRVMKDEVDDDRLVDSIVGEIDVKISLENQIRLIVELNIIEYCDAFSWSVCRDQDAIVHRFFLFILIH